jgi:glycosyltransferase involved in cell wall biosynthesis
MREKTTRSPRRVLFVNHSARISGAELSLLELLARLDRSRFEPTLACPAGPLADRARDIGVPVVPVDLRRIRRGRSLAGKASDLLDLGASGLRLARIIGDRHADIVHANSTTALLSAGPAARLTGIPVIWHVRDLVELGRAGKLLFGVADAVVCISQAVERHVSRCADGSGKLRTVPNGIDLAAFRASARPGTVRNELGIPAGGRVVTTVGQLTPWKGHDFLLNSLVKVREKFPDLHVLLVGEAMTPDDEAHAEHLRSRVGELGLAKAVIFTGWRDDAASVLADSDVVAVPSREEPFGRSALEAMALGRAAVGTRAGGLPELITDGETGLLVDFGDEAALSNAIIKLLGSPRLRRTLGEKAAQDAERFDVARTAIGIQSLYDELLAGTKL